MSLYILFFIFVIVIVAGHYLKSPAVKGRRSEQAVAQQLNIDIFRKHGGKVLTNVYVPNPTGGTAEIDILYITHKGLLVFENKNYAGYIFGSETNKSWTVTLYAGKSGFGRKKIEKHQFYNPIWQNRTHIKCLKEYLESNIKMFSLVTFSDRGDLKSITVNSPDVYVCNHARLSRVLREIWSNNPDILSTEQIENLYNNLLPLTNADKNLRKKHVSDIQTRFSSTDICPVCGSALIIRTARKGSNAGNRFYGCSNYPKCKYTKDLNE